MEGIMKKLLITLLLLSSMALASSSSDAVSADLPNGIEYSQAPAPVYSNNDDAASLGIFYNSPVAYSQFIRNEGPSLWPEQDWGYDVRVTAKAVGSAQDFDVDQDNDDIYAIMDTDHATNDSIIVYRSQNGGETWAFWRATYNSSGIMSNPQIRVVKNAANQTWVCMFYLLDGTTLTMRRMTPDQSTSVYETVTASSVNWYNVDGEIGTGGWVYAAYALTAGNDVWAGRNALSGGGWVSNTSLFVDPQVTPYPAIAVGSGGLVSVSFVDTRMTTNDEIRIKTSSNYASSWGASTQVSNNLSGLGLSETTMAYSHGATATGWIFTTFAGSSDNLGYYYSTNSGANWTYGTVMSGSGDENMADVRTNKSSGSLTLAFNSDPGDSTMFAWAQAANPTAFTAPDRINDHDATGYWCPAAGWVGGNSAVLYATWSMSYSPYFDWFGNTATEEETSASMSGTMQISSSPNPFTDMTTINFSVTGTEPVSISVYNISGRLIETIVDNGVFSPGDHSVQWNGSAVTPGVYFCRLDTGGSILTNRMVMVR
jgi:hypothetical protein